MADRLWTPKTEQFKLVVHFRDDNNNTYYTKTDPALNSGPHWLRVDHADEDFTTYLNSSEILDYDVHKIEENDDDDN